MKKILIATHSHFASGIKGTVELLTGPKSNIWTIDAFSEDSDLVQELNDFVKDISRDDWVYIFTDIKFGSVNQSVMNALSPLPENVFVISGFNLPVLLELSLTDECFDKKQVEEIVNKAKEEIVLMNNYVGEESSDEGDFFE